MRPWMLAGVSVTLIGVVVLTAIVPAYRAARVDPLVALKVE